MDEITTVHVSGVPVHVVEFPHVRDVAGGVLVRAGTVDENWPEEAGIAHAAEHMLFRGNSKFPTGKDITQIIEDTGGSANAFTFKEGTFYFGIVPSARSGDLFEYLTNLVFSPLFRPSDIEIEMKNVVQEIKKDRDNPRVVAQEQANEALFKDHVYSRRILGSEKSVASFSQEDFLRFHSELYNSSNIEFIVIGDISPNEVERLFQDCDLDVCGLVNDRSFSGMSPGKAYDDFRIVSRDIAQAHVCLKALLPAPSTRQTTALQVFATMVDGGMSFPMFDELRDKKGLCYTENVSVNTMMKNSVFSLYIATSPDKVQEAIDAMFEVINGAKSNTELLERAKSRISGKLDRKHGKTSETLQRMLEDVLYYDEFRSIDSVIEEASDISIDDVKLAVDQFLGRNSFAGAVVANEDFSL